MTKHFKIFLGIIALFIAGWFGLNLLEKDNDGIHIAFVGPLSGKDATTGLAMVRLIQLHLDEINAQSGTNQKEIILDIFDDRNNPARARTMAKKIVAQNKAVAVIGHNYSSCSIEAGKIYQKYGVPAITPVSTHVDVTQDNKWYFRTIFNNNLQGRFLAKYAKDFLKQDTVSIIHTDTPYGSSIAEIFATTLKELGGNIKYQWSLPLDNKQNQRITQIISDLQTKPDAGLIFLATHASEGFKLVSAIKDANVNNPLLAPDSYANKNFTENFKNYLKEKLSPNYYAHDIHISKPFILGTANDKARKLATKYQEKYQKELPWQAFYAVDAAIVLVEAIKQAKIIGQQTTISEDRKKIKNNIAGNFSRFEQAIEGTTGLNYFDKNGDAFKPISMLFYKGQNLFIADFNQLRVIPQRYQAVDSTNPLHSVKRVLTIDDKHFMYKTHVVYTGVKFNKISNFEPKNATYKLDFFLWFRFQDKIEPQNIKFINAIEPIELGEPITSEVSDNENYHLYRVKGHFKENLHPSVHQNVFFTQHLLGVSFRHQQLDRSMLVYVIDKLGMKLENNKSYLEKKDLIFDLRNKWVIKDTDFFQSILKEQVFGNPKYFIFSNAVEYSGFNANILIGNSAYLYHEIVPFKWALQIFIISVIMTLLIMLHVKYQYLSSKPLKYLWVVQVILIFLLLISGEIVVGEWFMKEMDETKIKLLLIFSQTLWWVIPAIFLSMAIERFLWIPLEEQAQRPVPDFMRVLISFLIYMLAFFGITAFVFDRPITSILATGGMLAAIIGLAIQINLSNIFSGIALSIEHSFRVGDWVKIGSFSEGVVVDMNWRVTQIRTRKSYILNIPNSIVSSSDIHNFSYPNKQYWIQLTVNVAPKYDPNEVEKILIKAVLAVKEGIVKDATPFIRLDSVDGETITDLLAGYVVFFKSEDYKYKLRVLRDVRKSIWTHLKQAKIITPAITQPETFDAPAVTEEILTKEQLHDMIVKG